MIVRILNRSSLDRHGWADVSIPHRALPTPETRVLLAPLGPAWRGRELGVQRALWHVPVQVGYQQDVILGPLVGPPPVLRFQASDWVTDDLPALIPMIRLDGEPQRWTHSSLTMLDEVGPVQRWRLLNRYESGLVLDLVLRVYSGQDVIEFSGLLKWSDPTVPDPTKSFGRIEFVTSEPHVLDLGRALGFGQMRYEEDLWKTTILDNQELHHGQGIPLWGALLALPKDVPLPALLLSQDPMVRRRILNLASRLEAGKMEAVLVPPAEGRSDQEPWLAFGQVPDADAAYDEEQLARASAQAFELRRDAGWLFQPRAMGLLPFAGTTGEVGDDYGSTRGLPLVTLADPQIMDLYRHGVSEVLRPVHYCEANGEPIKAKDHPDWVSYNQQTHFNSGVSSDRLGKGVLPPAGTGGWSGKDDQHRSSNTLHTLFALTGDECAEMCIADEIEHDLGSQVGRADSPRAHGRCLLAMTNEYLLTGRQDILQRVDDRFGWGKDGATVNGDLVILGTVTDMRALVDEAGEPVKCWVVWEHGLAAIGYWAVAVRARATDEQQNFAWELARSILTHGVRWDGLTWHVYTHVAYNGGAPIPDDKYGKVGWTKEGGINLAWTLTTARLCVENAQRVTRPTSWTDEEFQALLQLAAAVLAWFDAQKENDWRQRQWDAVGP